MLLVQSAKKRVIFKGYQHRQLKTRFGPTFFALPRLRCQPCGRLFQLNSGCLADLKALAEANISPGLKQVAIHCAAAWPYRQAQQSIQRLIGVAISHEQIRQLCLQEAVRVEAQEQANFQQAYEQALAETVEVLVEEQPRPKKPPQIEPCERVYLGIDGTLIKARAQNRFMEAKVGIVFAHQLAVMGSNRRRLLNKQYVGTLQSVLEFGQQLFTTARGMGIDNQEQLVVLSDGARWINKLAQTQYPKATLILDWWHLKRRVWPTVRGLQGDGLSAQDGRDWGRQWIDRLWPGQVSQTLKSIMVLASQLGGPPLDQPAYLAERSLPALHQFISNNQAAMIDYHRFQQAGYYIGSAVVEKAVDLLVCRRQKLRGQNWSRTGADRLLCWRQLILNDQWDEYWQPAKAA